MRTTLVIAGVLAAAVVGEGRARACGCFTPPDAIATIVQNGERIVFAVDGGEVTAHIQIQYAGDAADFGWILPLPAVPTLELGTDELFAQLLATTSPTFQLTTATDGQCFSGGGGSGFACSSAEYAASGSFGGVDAGPSDPMIPGGPLVFEESIGPYDYAVLHADDKTAMLASLAENHYFVPAGTDGAVDAYIHPGAYFLALKLKSGKQAGDLQPVVVRYASDLPMIPIVLTSVAANPDMGIQVWLLGAGRAIPRNYHHTVINDAKLDWRNGARNYNDLIIAATREAPGPRHTFVTEYAGSSDVMNDRLDFSGRFGSTTALAARPDAVSFVEYLNSHSYRYTEVGGTQLVYPSQLLAVLQGYIPVPPALAVSGVGPSQFYADIRRWLIDYRMANPGDFVGYTIDYRPEVIAQEIDERVVQPARAAAALFDDHPYLTRLYTTLSPENMDRDPVFGFNAALPVVANLHRATLTLHCDGGATPLAQLPATLTTASGFNVEYDGAGVSIVDTRTLPASLRIEILAEDGPPQVLTDNRAAIAAALLVAKPEESGGCGIGRGGRGVGVVFLVLIAGLRYGAGRGRRSGSTKRARASTDVNRSRE